MTSQTPAVGTMNQLFKTTNGLNILNIQTQYGEGKLKDLMNHLKISIQSGMLNLRCKVSAIVAQGVDLHLQTHSIQASHRFHMKPLSAPLTQFLKDLFNTSLYRLKSLLVSTSDSELIALIAAYDRGRDISFGGLSASLEGLNIGPDILPWSALRSFRLTNRELVLVRQFGNRFNSHRVSIHRIHHLPILLHLLERHSKVQTTALAR